MPPRWWEKLQEGYAWKDRFDHLDPIVPCCATHEWSAWRESSGFLCGRSGGGLQVWQSARCVVCGRVGVREIYRRRGRAERVLGEITVTDQGAVPQSMQPRLREKLLQGDLW